MSFGGPPVTTETIEEADELQLSDEKESAIGNWASFFMVTRLAIAFCLAFEEMRFLISFPALGFFFFFLLSLSEHTFFRPFLSHRMAYSTIFINFMCF
jgi:hypothetical protein